MMLVGDWLRSSRGGGGGTTQELRLHANKDSQSQPALVSESTGRNYLNIFNFKGTRGMTGRWGAGPLGGGASSWGVFQTVSREAQWMQVKEYYISYHHVDESVKDTVHRNRSFRGFKNSSQSQKLICLWNFFYLLGVV